jgi:putative transposase
MLSTERVAQRYGLFAFLCGSWWGNVNSGSSGYSRGLIIARMLRLRRLVLSDRWFFITCRVLPRRRHLSDSEFATLAQVIAERRAEHRFFLTAWVLPPVLPPDHGHAILYLRHSLTISQVMEAIKDGATKRNNRSRRETGTLWQPRFFDRALGSVEEYNAKVEHIHWNLVKAGLVSRPEEWSRRAGWRWIACCCPPMNGLGYNGMAKKSRFDSTLCATRPNLAIRWTSQYTTRSKSSGGSAPEQP